MIWMVKHWIDDGRLERMQFYSTVEKAIARHNELLNDPEITNIETRCFEVDV